jgi:lipopolysaccharide export system protein LptC
MINRLRSWLPILPLLLLLGASYWLNLQVQSPADGSKSSQRHDPDYIVDNLTATTLDAQGKVRYIMSAKKMLHYPDDDTTQLEEPQFQSFTTEYPPMHMTAKNGEISSKGEDVFLRNDVVIVRPAYANKSELTINTHYLHIMPNKDLITSTQPVTIVDALTKLNAVGMELDNNAHTIKLLSQVKSVYEPVKK